MLAFEVTLNNERLCIAGLYAHGGVHVMMDTSRYEHSPNQDGKGSLSVSGLIEGEHVKWVDGFDKLRVGDAVVVRLIDAAESDPPRRLSLRVDDSEDSHLGPVQSGRQCAFCTKRESEVRSLVNLGVPELICDECIGECVVSLRDAGIDVCPQSTA